MSNLGDVSGTVGMSTDDKDGRMPIAITDEHREMADVVRALFETRYQAEARRAVDGEMALPGSWGEVAGLGWLGLHLPERHGGSGYGLFELAVVVAELGRHCAPGPFLPTVVLSAVVGRFGSEALQAELLPGLADGSRAGGLGLWGAASIVDGVLGGSAGPVLGADLSSTVLLAVGDDLVVVDTPNSGVTVGDRESIDLTRPCPPVALTGVAVADARVLTGAAAWARDLFRVLAAAEAAGGAHACVAMASGYAIDRTAFGRPIGQFQAVKHHCANMLVAAEMATAAAWDGARAADSAQAGAADGPTADELPLAAAVAASVALNAYSECAKLNVQVHGGIGYTWEHDAHLHLRRATALAALAGPVAAARQQVADLVAGGARRTLAVDLPPEAEPMRAEVRAFAERFNALGPAEGSRLLVEEGYLFPHWPRPWGRGAGPVEQLVIDEGLAGIDRMAGFPITSWTWPIVLPTIIRHGTESQRERWIGPTFDAAVTWCQLFSEPGAGSDLAALATRAVRTDGGWLVTGAKVWTSTAQFANLGFALVRTDPAASAHHGITCMAIDMTAPGMTVIPLREMTGGEMFSQEFLDEVFVPDENVIGEVNKGWAVARTTLGNERVSLGSATEHEILTDFAGALDLNDSSLAVDLGALLAESFALQALNLRQATRAVGGGEPGAEGNITKLVHAEHVQRIADFTVRAVGSEALYADGPGSRILTARAGTIAGGTSEIVRNTIAERLLGLPRDPRPR